MADEPERHDPADAAREALAQAAQMRGAALRRGAPPRWLAAATGLWTAALGVTVGMESPIKGLLLLALVGGGVAGLAHARRRMGAWMIEVGDARDAVLVAILGLVVGALLLAGPVLRGLYGLDWAPLATGGAAGLGVFLLMEAVHGPARRAGE